MELFFFSILSGCKPKSNQLGAERKRRPELMCQIIFALQEQKRYFAIYLRNAIFLNYRIKFARLM